MLLALILNIHSLIVPLGVDKPARFINNILAKTVVLLEAELLYRESEMHDWTQVADPDSAAFNLDIYISNSKDWKDIYTNATLVSENIRTGVKNSFFFTAPQSNYYLYELYTTHELKTGQYGIQTLIHEGQAGVATIKSMVDNRMKETEYHVREATEKAHHISDILKLDLQVDEEYRKVVSSIEYIIFIAIFMKIGVCFCMFGYYNKKLQEFYVSKKIVK